MSKEGRYRHRADFLIEASGSDNSFPQNLMATWVLSLKCVECSAPPGDPERLLKGLILHGVGGLSGKASTWGSQGGDGSGWRLRAQEHQHPGFLPPTLLGTVREAAKGQMSERGGVSYWG